MGQKGGLPTVCPGLSQDGDKGQNRDWGPGGQVRRDRRDTKRRVGAGGSRKGGMSRSWGNTRSKGKGGQL